MSEEVYRGEPGEEIEIKVDARLPGGWRRSLRCKRGHRNFRDGSTQAGTRCLKRRKKGQRESSECKRFCSTESYTGAEEGRKEGEEWRMGGTGTTAYPHRRRPIHHRLPTRTRTGMWGNGGIRVLYPEDANGGWCEFAGAGNTSSVWYLDVNKVGAADSLSGVVMVMVFIVVERIKRSTREGWRSAQMGCR
jgi:hypothetical protein